ncbi:MAG: hypothetical protein AAF236_03160 [Verrucomicrobiota bacterium]
MKQGPDFQKNRERLLLKLTRAGRDGLTRKRLVGQSRAQSEVLKSLLKSGEIIVFAPKRRGALYFHSDHLPTARSVADRISAYLDASGPRLRSSAELKRHVAEPGNQSQVEAALKLLVTDNLVACVTNASRTKYYFSRAALGLSGGGAKASSTKLTRKSVRAAYEAITQKTGFSSVEIALLAEEGSFDLDQLKSHLVAESKAHEVVLSVGDWAASNERTHPRRRD